jgi:hypothetical protein
MNQPQLTALAAAVLLMLPVLAQAQAEISIKVATTETENIIRHDISRTTFGTGIEAGRSELGWALNPTRFKGSSEDENQLLEIYNLDLLDSQTETLHFNIFGMTQAMSFLIRKIYGVCDSSGKI